MNGKAGVSGQRARFIVRRLLLALAIIVAANAASAASSKRILLLTSDPHTSPGLVDLEVAFRRVIAESGIGPVAIDVEHLDTVYNGSPEAQQLFSELFKAKYANRQPDVVLTIGASVMRFAVAQREALFPQATILAGHIQRSDLQGLPTTALTAVASNMEVGEELTTALRILPKTRRAIVILGSGPAEHNFEPAWRRDIGRFENRLDISWWVGMPMGEMERRIAHLPPNTVVVYLGMYRDDAGESFSPMLALEHLATHSNAPIFGSPAQWVGHGSVGDGRWSLPDLGRRLGEASVRLLGGAPPQVVGIVDAPSVTQTFDARELDRWNVPRRLLPKGSRLVNDQPSLWEQHRVALFIGLAVMVVQAGLLIGLVTQRIARRRAEHGEMESKTLYDAVADSLDERIATLASDGTIVAVNRAWINFAENHFATGITVGGNYLEAVKSALNAGREDARMTLESLEAVLSGRDSSRTVGYFSTGSGERWRYEMRIVALRRRAGGVVVTIQDVTDRWRSEERIRVALESLPVAIVLLGEDCRIELLNGEAERLFGYSREELLGRSVETILPECIDRIYLSAERRDRRETEMADQLDRNSNAKRKDGKDVPVAVHFRSISMASRRVLLVSILDLSERRRVDVEIQKLRDETAHFGRVATVGEMSAAIAHELNQPLTGIMTNCQAAQRFIERGTISVHDMNELFSDIVADARRAGEVIQRLRLMLRKAPAEAKSLDINETVQQVVRVVGHDLALRGSALDLELTEDLPRVTGDRIHLQQVILNLVLNGADAMSGEPIERRRMRLRTMPGPNSTVELELRDNGPGLSADAMEHLFQPFFTTKPHGLGMGLSIVRSIVETHGGSIKCINAASGGAVFTVVLPAASENQAA